MVSSPGILIIPFAVGWGGFAFDYSCDIIFAFLIELLLPVRIDYVIGWSDTASYIADFLFIESKCFERFNFHRVKQE
jgi:hypothetical protein